MDGMDIREAIEDISKRCGLSEDIIRRVQAAETEYVIENLKRGKRVNISGRGTYRAEVKNKLQVGGSIGTYIKPTFAISSKITSALEECNRFITKEDEEENEKLPEGILSMQISSLV